MVPEDSKPNEQRLRELEEEFAAVLTISDPNERVDQILELAPLVSPGLLSQPLSNLHLLPSEELRAKLTVGLAPYLTPPQIDSTALLVSSQFSVTELRLKALGALGRYMVPQLREKVIHEISSGPSPETRMRGWIE